MILWAADKVGQELSSPALYLMVSLNLQPKRQPFALGHAQDRSAIGTEVQRPLPKITP